MISADYSTTTLSGLTLKFGLLAVAAIGIQSFPVSAVLTMPLMGFYWFGVIANLYMVWVAYAVFNGQLERSAIVIPAAFYGLGLLAGVYSDVMAWRYARGHFVEVHRTIPKDVRYVAFSPSNQLRTYHPLEGELRPEKADFSFAALRFPSTFDHSNNYEWLPVQVKDRVLCDEARSHPAHRQGADIHRIGDRCYVAVSIPAPDKFLRIGGPMHSFDPQTVSPPPLQYPWGRLFFEETNIVLHDNGSQEVVGKLRGGIIRKLPYLFLPAFSCAGLFTHARDACGGTWFMAYRDQRIGFFPSVTGSSDATVPLLMDALIRLRG